MSFVSQSQPPNPFLSWRFWRLWLPINLGVFAGGMISTAALLRLTQFNPSPTIIGIFAACYWGALLLAHLLSSRLIQRFGIAASYKFGILLALIAALGFITTTDIGIWWLCHALLGIAFSFHWVIGQIWLIATTPRQYQGRVLTLDEVLGGMMFTLNPLLVTLLGVSSTVPLWVAMGLLLLAWLMLLPMRSPHAEVPAQGGGLRKMALVPASAVLMMVAFVGGVAENGVNAVLPLYGLGLGLPLESAALLVSVAGVGNVLAQLPLGWWADRVSVTALARTIRVMMLALLLMLLLLPLAGSGAGLWWVVATLGGVAGSLYTLALIQAGKRYDVGQLSIAIPLVASATTLGAMMGPLLSGFGMEWNATWGMSVSLGMLVMLCGVIWLRR